MPLQPPRSPRTVTEWLLPVTPYAPIVTIKTGQIRGVVRNVGIANNNEKVFLYQGIPYGQAERFRAPRPAPSWHPAVYDATHWREACPQTASNGGWLSRIRMQTNKISENCLYLNVWQPEKNSTNGPRTVMFWIHGGSFTCGTIFSFLYDGRYIASIGDVIVVTVNYRLGPFGFLYAGDDGNDAADTNVGICDVILALNWVQDNIASFGGDPHRVTVFGESAGSITIGALLLSPLARGLFSRAIMQSGAPNSMWGNMSKSLARKQTQKFAASVNCATNDTDSQQMIRCLRAVPMETLVNAYVPDSARHNYFLPIYGDTVIPVAPIKLINNPSTTDINVNIDLMFGVVDDEGTMFTPTSVPQILRPFTHYTKNDTERLVKQIFAKMPYRPYLPLDMIGQYYAGMVRKDATQKEIKQIISSAYGDSQLLCPTILFAESFAREQHRQRQQQQQRRNRYRIYSYRLTQHVFTEYSLLGVAQRLDWFGVVHGEDVLNLFVIPSIISSITPPIISSITPQIISTTVRNTQTYALAAAMIRTWSRFAKTGSPGSIGEENVEWTEAFDNNDDDNIHHHNQSYTPKYMNLHVNQFGMIENKYVNNCDQFWRPLLQNALERI